jgi:hypothetical protein
VDPVLCWLLTTGLHRYGYDELGEALAATIKGLVHEHGPCEAFDALTGAGLGRRQDPLTASVTLHLVRAPFADEQISHF